MGQAEYTRDDIENSWKNDFKQTLPANQVVTNSLGHSVRTYHYLLAGSKKGTYRLGVRGSDLINGLPNPDENLRGAARKTKKSTKAKKSNK